MEYLYLLITVSTKFFSPKTSLEIIFKLAFSSSPILMKMAPSSANSRWSSFLILGSFTLSLYTQRSFRRCMYTVHPKPGRGPPGGG